MIKRKLRRILPMFCVALLLSGIVALSACSDKEGKEGEAETTTAAEVEAEEDRFPFEDVKLSDYVTLGEYKGVEPEFLTGKFSKDELMEEALFYFKYYRAPLGIKEDKSKTVVKEGDYVEFDFEGTAEGVSETVLANMKDTNFVLEIGSGNFIDGFEEQIKGKTKGKEFKVDVTFPEDYTEESLRGKPVVFTCTVHKIGTGVMTDDSVSYLTSGEIETVADFLDYVEEQMINSVPGKNVMIAFDTAFENAEVTIPKEEKDYYVSMMISEPAAYYGVTDEEYAVEYEKYESLAAFREKENDPQIKKDLFAFAVAEQEGFEITAEDIAGFLDYVRSSNSNMSESSDEEIIAQYTSEYIYRSIMTEIVANFIYENAVGADLDA